MSNIRRILKRLDGGISIIMPAPNSKREDETEQEWLNRVFTKANPDNLPYEDIDVSELPTREYRNAWKWHEGEKKIKIDSVKKEEIDEKNAVEAELKVMEEEKKAEALARVKNKVK